MLLWLHRFKLDAVIARIWLGVVMVARDDGFRNAVWVSLAFCLSFVALALYALITLHRL